MGEREGGRERQTHRDRVCVCFLVVLEGFLKPNYISAFSLTWVVGFSE
jgi:hypothetical protein